MDESIRSILEGLKKAIETETNGYHFYMMAAKSTQDPKGREAFETLASEEQKHEQFLRTQYRSVIENGSVDPKVKLGPRASFEGSSPIFSEEIRGRIKDAHYEMTALSIGIQLELSSIDFYKDEAEATDNPDVRKFYLELADWETGHYEALLRQHDLLKEDYWSAARFAPF
jgi:rubrerythrin